MWHPFDLMPEALALLRELRDASVSTGCRLAYRQLVTRWFKDKSSDEQWPPDLDTRPGIVLTRRLDNAGCWHVEVEQTWELAARRSFTGTLVCETRGWRRPVRYDFRQTFATKAGAEVWPETRETGKWHADGTLVRQSFVGEKSTTQRVTAGAWFALYALLADFPAWPDSWPAAEDAACAGEGVALLRGVRLQRCEQPQSRHALAQGLRGYTLHARDSMPQEFWINENGVVVYWFEGPNRAMALSAAEGLV